MLRTAIARSGQDASLHHALGLVLVRLKQSDAGLDELRHAAELETERARYAYVYAVGLQSTRRRGDATETDIAFAFSSCSLASYRILRLPTKAVIFITAPATS